jgi:hypoxanthine phosphoribosyltransferase
MSTWKRSNLYVMDWSVLGEALDSLCAQIAQAAARPDSILAVSRGGLPVAVHLANHLDIDDFRVIAVSRNTSGGRFSEKHAPRLEWVSWCDTLTGRSVLVVDDVVGEGATLEFVVKLARGCGAARVDTAALVRMAHASGSLDYVGAVLDDWVVFPWERLTDAELPQRPVSIAGSA